MVERLPYMPKQRNEYNVSTQNEPAVGYTDIINARLYPDMFKTYHTFAHAYDLSLDNFILTNGCENALRIAILAMKPEKMLIEDPTWRMAEVICSAFEVPYQKVPYHYYGGMFELEKVDAKDCWLYTTDIYGNLFRHKQYDPKIYPRVILDETYTMRVLRNPNRTFDENVIVIGSFSKFAGCGLRLGYILFNSKYNKKFQLLREQYISAAACQYVQKQSPIRIAGFGEKEEYPVVTKHPSYVTFIGEANIRYPHKSFVIDGQPFYRIGK